MPSVTSKDLEIIALKLDQVQEKQQETGTKVSDIKEGLYNPNEGLFTQVRDLKLWSDEHEKHDEEMREEVHEIARSAQKVQILEEWKDDHEERDEDLRKSVQSIAASMKPLSADYNVRKVQKKWTDKILWAILAAIIAGVIPLAKHFFVDAEHDSERLDKIEKMLERQSR